MSQQLPSNEVIKRTSVKADLLSTYHSAGASHWVRRRDKRQTNLTSNWSKLFIIGGGGFGNPVQVDEGTQIFGHLSSK